MENDKDVKNILIVDDSDVHLLIADNLLKEKYKTVMAKSGKEALRLLTGGYTPNLILLDILMPDMDGWETFNLIKGINHLRDVPVAFLTSLNGAREKQYAANIGAADMISKPYDGDDLLNRIDKMLNYQPEIAEQS